MKLPVDYNSIPYWERKIVREEYIKLQNGNCWHCKHPLKNSPPESILSKKINWKLFPKGFLNHPIHLQHDHKTGMTEGAVHAYCNCVLWQYYDK